MSYTTSTDGEATSDPSAVDLEAIQAHRKLLENYHGNLTIADVDNLIIAVEALRARVAALVGLLKRSEELLQYGTFEEARFEEDELGSEIRTALAKLDALGKEEE